MAIEKKQMNRKHKNPELDFLRQFAKAPYTPVTLEQVIDGQGAYSARRYRKFWDQNTERVGKAWYLQREKGLLAYSRYETTLKLKPFAKDGFLRAEDYVEFLIHEGIRRLGIDAISRPLNSFIDWPSFLDHKRRTDPTFFKRLGQWLHKGRDLDKNRPDSRFILYACMYDRHPAPLEFCTDSYAVWLMNERLQKQSDWLETEKAIETNEEAVRGWRKKLGLKLSRPVVAKLGKSAKGQTLVIFPDAAAKHGIPVKTLALVNPIPKKRN